MSELKYLAEKNILYRQWYLENPQAVLLLVHGIGAHSARWEFLAKYFLANNISSYALELKGFGENQSGWKSTQSKELPGHIDSFKIYYKDIQLLREQIKLENSGKKVFLVSESMGALICFVLSIKIPNLFDGLIFISPAFKSALKFSILEYLKMYLALLSNQKRLFKVPFTSEMCTQDVAYQQAMDNDARELRVASVSILIQILISQIQSILNVKKLKSPTLFLISGQDEIVDTKAIKKMFHKLSMKDKKIIEYPEMRHALSIELEREKVFKDIWCWIENRLR
ncbi:MAG: lysophospholipase [Candidatus Margulisbacteria bacterium]|nr:lysophospholipase [Candidatus Margulisiibacteriota bacterium]